MSGPLTGFRVLDLSRVLAGPAATVLLADQGADVIKVEPLKGDVVRAMGGGGVTPGFLTANRGKRSVALDLKSEAGVDVVRRLASHADVFVQNFRPGAIEGMGLGEPVIRRINPAVVYVSMSGFGETGPYAHKRVYDPVIQALSGLADLQATDENDRPRMMRTVIPDKTTGLTAAQAITAALLSRERTGQGQHVRLSMLDTMIAYLWQEGLGGLTMVGQEDKVKRGQRSKDLIYETADGYITAGAVSDAEWEGLCAALDRPQWLEDERFATPRARGVNVKIRLEMTAEVLRQNTSAYWLARLDEHGVPSAPVLSRPEVIEQEQVRVNDIVREYDHPGLGRVRQPRAAARFERTPTNTEQLAPVLGEHGREVLGEFGFSEHEIAALESDGVLGGARQD
ncbi:MAG: CoA transferase [Pseudomonadales bacterium]|nr:CoA transferase [Pseudomonadales bacterium]MDP6472362.1 CoA transferase [Pseudomonadales bacterium]MDP6828158.1 CoA transferase [Pseudomonadales bacterium]MDP6973457.1 CoA transferase [Pseudomonadales bacterium]